MALFFTYGNEKDTKEPHVNPTGQVRLSDIVLEQSGFNLYQNFFNAALISEGHDPAILAAMDDIQPEAPLSNRKNEKFF